MAYAAFFLCTQPRCEDVRLYNVKYTKVNIGFSFSRPELSSDFILESHEIIYTQLRRGLNIISDWGFLSSVLLIKLMCLLGSLPNEYPIWTLFGAEGPEISFSAPCYEQWHRVVRERFERVVCRTCIEIGQDLKLFELKCGDSRMVVCLRW